jgi:hypothetical protein
VSQWLQGKIAEALISPELKRKYEDWHLAGRIKDYPIAPDQSAQPGLSL